MPKISVHIIAKETTEFGKMMFRAALDSLLFENPGYADEIVFINNSYDQGISSMVAGLTRAAGVPTQMLNTDIRGFDKLRNICLANTSKDTDYIHWVDTDDFYHSRILNNFKDKFLTSDAAKDLNKGVCYFYHCMGCPWLIEEKYPKDNFFKYNPNLKWSSGVHEKLVNLSPGREVIVPYFYYHTGYIRSVISTAFKWVFYAVLEHGSADVYMRDNEPMYTKGINSIIEERLDDCRNILENPYEVPIVPEKFSELTGRYHMENEESNYVKWQYWVNTLDPFLIDYYNKWTEVAEKDGHWGQCIRDIEKNRLWEKY